MSGTVIPSISDTQFQRRLAALIPDGWAGSDSLQTGLVGALLRSIGGGLSQLVAETQYAADAMRLTTETAPELDLASLDFFGGDLPRPPGMSDSAFATLIIDSLFKSAATRPSIAAALTKLTGVTPRMLEPWNIFDTGVWARQSYWNVDTPANPARWASDSSRYQGFIETVPVAVPLIGPNNPIYCWGSGPLGPYWNVPGYFFAVIAASPAQSIDDVVNRLRAAGTTVWVKLLNNVPPGTPVLPTAATSLQVSNVTFSGLTLSWVQPTTGSTPLQYLVQYRVQGTQIFQSGPTVATTSANVSGLQPNTLYDLQVIVHNTAGSGPASGTVSATTPKQPPSPATNLVATQVQSTAVTLTWSAPISGTPPFSYIVQFRVLNTLPWSTFGVGLGSTGVTVIGLQPGTTYQFEVVTSTT